MSAVLNNQVIRSSPTEIGREIPLSLTTGHGGTTLGEALESITILEVKDSKVFWELRGSTQLVDFGDLVAHPSLAAAWCKSNNPIQIKNLSPSDITLALIPGETSIEISAGKTVEIAREIFKTSRSFSVKPSSYETICLKTISFSSFAVFSNSARKAQFHFVHKVIVLSDTIQLFGKRHFNQIEGGRREELHKPLRGEWELHNRCERALSVRHCDDCFTSLDELQIIQGFTEKTFHRPEFTECVEIIRAVPAPS